MTDFESWTDEDDAAVVLESLPAWHPSLFVNVFRTGLKHLDDAGALRILREGFITPESVEAWGDFAAAREVAKSDLKISMTAWWGIEAPDVAYVRLVDTDAWISPNTDQLAAMHVTLVWRPELAVVPGSSWRIHALGEPLPPQLVPRTAVGFDPRKLA
jgi:hypothetical protein